MYSLTIIETKTYRQALIARAILEGAGYPSVAGDFTVAVGDHAFAVFTSAPHGVEDLIEPLVQLYDAGGDRGLKRCQDVAQNAPKAPGAVPTELREQVRNALLINILTAAGDEHMAVVTEPALAASTNLTPVVDHDTGDEDTKPGRPVHNPEGGGFDGECIGANDVADKWKSGGRGADRYDY